MGSQSGKKAEGLRVTAQGSLVSVVAFGTGDFFGDDSRANGVELPLRIENAHAKNVLRKLRIHHNFCR